MRYTDSRGPDRAVMLEEIPQAGDTIGLASGEVVAVLHVRHLEGVAGGPRGRRAMLTVAAVEREE